MKAKGDAIINTIPNTNINIDGIINFVFCIDIAINSNNIIKCDYML